MPPASTLKLLTTVVALDRLGPNHRGFTDLLTGAALHGDVLAGDLVAARSVRAWLAQHQIPAAGLVLDNGSGLSRSERISPHQLVLLLQAAQAGRWALELLMSLPVAGVAGVAGSMRDRLKTSPAAGWARLKSGSLKNAVAVAGYVPDPQGRLWALAALVHRDQALAARPAPDALVVWVASGGMAARATGRQRVDPSPPGTLAR